ncbi:MAG: hypothetical protein IPK82_08335 [Polyangiaceae bacterium]|nr:hypothetical protein [Polyangiaceae bacterium]
MPRFASLICALSVASAAFSAVACVENTGNSNSSNTTSGTGATGGTGGGGGTGAAGGAAPATAREFFEQKVLPGLLKECGACHEIGGPADAGFLGDPDTNSPAPYDAITQYTGIVVKDAAKSILVVHPNEQSHGGGQAPPIPDDLKAIALEWLKMEAENLPDTTGDLVYTVTPFKPILGGALNTIYLDEIDPTLQYASISFNAKELDDSLLQLKNLEVHPVEGQAVHIIHPLFTVYPPKAAPDPDPVDSFSGVDQIFTLDSPDLSLGTGELIVTNWVKDAYLGIAFELIVNEGGGGPAVGCKDVTKFKNEVVPQMQYCADTCHGGANAQANATMDLSGLNADPPDAACAQVRKRITPGDPGNSQILIVTDPTQQAVHLYKFMGNKNKHAAFKTAVSPWILSEAQ